MNLPSILRFLQLYTHNAHNKLGGATFFADHEFLGGLYPVYEADYDAIVERIIGTKGSADLNSYQKSAVEMLEKYGEITSYDECFKQVLKGEELLCSSIEKLAPKSTQGTMNLLADIADRSEMRQYKIKQRLK